MEMPTPGAAHFKLERLVGLWMGEERVHPSPWDPKGGDAVGRNRQQIHHGDRPSSHRENVAHGVRRGDPAVVEGIVDERREEVDRVHDRGVGAQPVHARIVVVGSSGEETRMLLLRKTRQNTFEVRRTQLCRSTAARRLRRQAHPGCRPTHVVSACPGLAFRSAARPSFRRHSVLLPLRGRALSHFAACGSRRCESSPHSCRSNPVAVWSTCGKRRSDRETPPP